MTDARRIATLATVLGAVLILIGWLVVHHDETPPARTGPAPVAPSSTNDDLATDRALAGVPWREVTRRYATALTDTSGGESAWLGRLAPLVSPILLDSYRGADLPRLPEGRPVRVRPLPSAGAKVAATSPHRAQLAQVAYDSGFRLDVRLERSHDVWQVTNSWKHLRAPR